MVSAHVVSRGSVERGESSHLHWHAAATKPSHQVCILFTAIWTIIRDDLLSKYSA